MIVAGGYDRMKRLRGMFKEVDEHRLNIERLDGNAQKWVVVDGKSR
jgi:hypothetical protein